MSANIDIDLLARQNQLKTRIEVGKKLIFDPIRKKYLVWQPEELVRQLLLLYLIHEKNYNKNHIHVERGLTVNTQYRRCDIITYNSAIQPYLLVECKAPSISLNQAVFDQIAQYNLAFNVPYLLVSNGIQTFCCEMDYVQKTYQFLDKIPNGANNVLK